MFFAKFFALVLATTVIALPSDLESRAVTATPETHEVIGYRAVSEAEAKSINSVGWIYWNSAKMPAGSTASGMYGVGKSLGDEPGGVVILHTGATWYCYIAAEKTAFAKVDKVWLTRSKDAQWTETAVQEDIKKVDPEADAADCLRFGMCGNVIELNIPATQLGQGKKTDQGGPLGLVAKCYKTEAAMVAALKKAGFTGGDVNYSTFGIKGMPDDIYSKRSEVFPRVANTCKPT